MWIKSENIDIIDIAMKQWVLREAIPDEISKELEDQPELIRRILFYRGIKTKEDADKFLNPDYDKHQHSPFDILDMDKAVDRILLAIKNNERIIIFGDYDADGVSSSVIFYDFLQKVGFENFHVHIPDRNLDGYGLNLEAIEEFAKQKAGLIVTFDCGITDYEEVEKANSLGIDVVITDHHLAHVSPADGLEKLPPAFAIINSKREGDKYPFKYLSGAGVAFKVVQALVERGSVKDGHGFKIVPGWEKWLLDVVALATVADMVPLTGENRVFAQYGIKVLRKTRRLGFLAFFKKLSMYPRNVNEDDIAFMIAPRINIASRMDHADASFSLLTTQSPEEAKSISKRLDTMNEDRKRIVGEIMEEVESHLEAQPPSVIVAGNVDWQPGVLGIAANRLLEKYERPIFLWGKAESKTIKGSCRSDGSINLVDFMSGLPEGTLIESGGHAFAGGFSAGESDISKLGDTIVDTYKKAPKEEIENNILHVDGEMNIDDVNPSTFFMMEKMQPFGVDNLKPIFRFSGLEIDNIRKFGNGGIHLGLDFKNSKGKKVSAIGFFVGNNEKFDLSAGQRVDLLAALEKSFFRGITELRLRIVDVRKAERAERQNTKYE